MQRASFLANKTILVTRPAGRERNLLKRIQQAGGAAIHFPTIRIEQRPTDTGRLQQQLAACDMAIFISRTAVECLHESFRFPATIPVFAIGSQTRRALQTRGIQSATMSGFNSESLLRHPSLQADEIAGKNLLIFRGQGGRDYLREKLLERGAKVEYHENYRRCLPDDVSLDSKHLNKLSAITVNSCQALENLMRLLPDDAGIRHLPLIVSSPRVAARARQYDFTRVLTAENATDEAFMRALAEIG